MCVRFSETAWMVLATFFSGAVYFGFAWLTYWVWILMGPVAVLLICLGFGILRALVEKHDL